MTKPEVSSAIRPTPILSPADVAEFQVLLSRECKVRLNSMETWRRATQLIDLVRMLLGPIPEDPEASGSDVRVRRPATLPDGAVES